MGCDGVRRHAKIRPVSEFDEMLRAGAISPGSTPYVEAKRARAADHAEVTAQARVIHETRTSTTARAGGPRRPVQYPKASVLVVTADPAVAAQVQAALAQVVHAIVAADPGPLALGLTFDLVLADAALPDLVRLVTLAPNVLVLTEEPQLARAQSVATSARVRVLELPWNEGVLAGAVGSTLLTLPTVTGPRPAPRSPPPARR